MEGKGINTKISKKEEDEENDLRPILIGITGGTASGKTTKFDIDVISYLFTNILKELGMEDCSVISMDSFYKDLTEEELNHVADFNFDHPNAFDWESIEKVIDEVLVGKDFYIPTYDFCTNSRGKTDILVKRTPIVVFEGIFALYSEKIREKMDFKIYVDVDSDVRLARRLLRDCRERGRNVTGVLKQYMRFVKGACDEFIKPTMKYADIALLRGGDNDVAIQLIITNLQAQLKAKGYLDVNFNPIEETKQCSDEIITIKNSNTISTLSTIFADLITRKNPSFNQMFLNEISKNLFELVRPDKDSFIFIQKEMESEAEFEEKLKLSKDKLSLVNKICFFFPFLVTKEHVNKLIKCVKQVRNLFGEIKLAALTVFLCQASMEREEGLDIKYYTIYCSDKIKNFPHLYLHTKEEAGENKDCLTYEDYITCFNTLASKINS